MLVLCAVHCWGHLFVTEGMVQYTTLTSVHMHANARDWIHKLMQSLLCTKVQVL